MTRKSFLFLKKSIVVLKTYSIYRCRNRRYLLLDNDKTTNLPKVLQQIRITLYNPHRSFLYYFHRVFHYMDKPSLSIVLQWKCRSIIDEQKGSYCMFYCPLVYNPDCIDNSLLSIQHLSDMTPYQQKEKSYSDTQLGRTNINRFLMMNKRSLSTTYCRWYHWERFVCCIDKNYWQAQLIG